jgi:hypothetical protein
MSAIDEARARWEEAVSNSLKVIGETQHASNMALVEALERLTARTLVLEEQVKMLMDLHRISEAEEKYVTDIIEGK